MQGHMPSCIWINFKDLPGSIHEDIVMDGHRQGKKAYAYKYPLTFLKWWSRLKNIHCPCRDNSIPQPVPLLTNLLANLNFPTSKRYLFLNSLKLCPLLTPSPTTWKKNYLDPNSQTRPLSILKLHWFIIIYWTFFGAALCRNLCFFILWPKLFLFSSSVSKAFKETRGASLPLTHTLHMALWVWNKAGFSY